MVLIHPIYTEEEMKKTEILKKWVITEIEQGGLTNGAKLPAQRILAEMFNINRSTVQQALSELAEQELVCAKAGAGVFVTNAAWEIVQQKTPNWPMYIQQSFHLPNKRVIQRINELEQQPQMTRLGTGELAPELLAHEAVSQALKMLTIPASSLGYSSPQGDVKLRQLLVERLKKKGIHVTVDEIMIVSGTLQALQLYAMALLKRGDYVQCAESSYLQSIETFQSFGIHLVQQDILRELNNVEALYAIPTLNNPTGTVWNLAQRQRVLAKCAAAKLPIIEDDVYGELLFHDTLPPLKAMDQANQIIYLNSFSKTVSPGLRIGWVVGPREVIARMSDVKMQTDYGSSAISQLIAYELLQNGAYDAHIKQLRQQLQYRAQQIVEFLQREFSTLSTWQTPHGGFYIWLRFKQPIVTEQLFEHLASEGILINPGFIYNPHNRHHIRVSYAYASIAQITVSLGKLKAIITH